MGLKPFVRNRLEAEVRPTTKDLAKAAGVSLATVDRVLNERPGVKSKTVERVNRAIQEIGFVRNISAANLARNKNYNFIFVVPRAGDQFLEEILSRIDEANYALSAEAIAVSALQVDESDPHVIVRQLNKLAPDKTDGVAIMAPETPQTRDAIVRLQERGIYVTAFVSNQTNLEKSQFVGIDNRAAGRTAGLLMGRFSCMRKGSVIVVSETMQSRDSLERRLGFDATINAEFPHLSVLPSLETYGDPTRTKAVIGNAIAGNPDLVGIYVLSAEARIPLNAISASDSTRKVLKIVHERTPFTEHALESGSIDAVIKQDPGHLVRSAIRIMKAKHEGRELVASQEKIRIEILLRENL